MASHQQTQHHRALEVLRRQGIVRLRDFAAARIAASTVARIQRSGEIERIGRLRSLGPMAIQTRAGFVSVDLIFDDVLLSLEAGRRPVILTERRDHLDHLRARFEKFTRHLVVLYGGMTAAERNAADAALKRPDTEERLVLATGRYLGKGFDDASLDTLFLTMPISWKGTLAQYVGRLHREHHAKREVVVYDYVDSVVPMLARMALKRQTGYRSLGYEIAPVGPGNLPPTIAGTTKA